MEFSLPLTYRLTNTRKVVLTVILILVALIYWGTAYIFEGLGPSGPMPIVLGLVCLLFAIYFGGSARVTFQVDEQGISFKKHFSRASKVQPIAWADIVRFEPLYVSGIRGTGGSMQGMFYTKIVVNQPEKYFPNRATNEKTAVVLTFWHKKGLEEDPFTEFLKQQLILRQKK